MLAGMADEVASADEVMARLSRLRQNSVEGQPAPHKPLLVLLALARLTLCTKVV